MARLSKCNDHLQTLLLLLIATPADYAINAFHKRWNRDVCLWWFFSCISPYLFPCSAFFTQNAYAIDSIHAWYREKFLRFFVYLVRVTPHSLCSVSYYRLFFSLFSRLPIFRLTYLISFRQNVTFWNGAEKSNPVLDRIFFFGF